MFIEINKVTKSYGEKEGRVVVLREVNTQLEKGMMGVILGPSGSGKSTLLNLIGGLESIDSGEIVINGRDISKLSVNDLSKYRRDELGFIFQFYNLVPNLTVRENIEVCEYLTKQPLDIDDLLNTLGLKEHQNKFPKQLSGGQQQRTAIARALIKNPKLLLCDEPTGALDYKNSKEILMLLETINKIYNTTMLIVTHNSAIKDMVHKVIKVKDGMIVESINNKELIKAEDLDW